MHVALRRNGEVLPQLSHIFAAMGRPYAVRAIPPECPQGKENCKGLENECNIDFLHF